MINYMPDFSTLYMCNHCGHKWHSHKIGVIPRVCPVKSCQSPRWDNPTRRKLPVTQIRSLDHLKTLVTVTSRGCWEWNHGRTSYGYGLGVLNGRRVMAHRMIWYLKDGVYPSPNDFICHRCDNPPCCNPDHLFIGTQTDNMRDCVDKGRHTQHEATHCQRGHARTPDNLYVGVTKRNGRPNYVCKVCHGLRVRAYKVRLKAKKLEAVCV